jgi:hypothetical protein
MLVRQQSPLILRCNLLDDDHGSALAISLNWLQQDWDGETAQQPPQWQWQDCNIGASAITFNLAVRHLWQWWWQRVRNLLEFLTAVTLQCKRISNLLKNDGVQASATSLKMTVCNALANSLIQRHLWVGSWVVACWSWHLPLGRVPKFGSRTKKIKRSKFSCEGFQNLILFYKVPDFHFFKSIVPAVCGERNGNGGMFF